MRYLQTNQLHVSLIFEVHIFVRNNILYILQSSKKIMTPSL